MNMFNPLTSIIIPTYNAAKYISETIESVINQTYSNWELLVVDDCSQDDTLSVVASFADERIKFFRTPTNSGGPAGPRNLGVSYSQGEYIAFLDADDLWMPSKLEEQLFFMKKHQLNFSSTSAFHINARGDRLGQFYWVKKLIRKFRKYSLESLLRRSFIYSSSVIMHRSIFRCFNEEKLCVSVEDFYLWLILLNSESVSYGYLNKELLSYRFLETSISERTVVGKQEVKALYFLARFIIENGRYDLLKIIKK